MKKTAKIIIISSLVFSSAFSFNGDAQIQISTKEFYNTTQIITTLNTCNSEYYRNTIEDIDELQLYDEIKTALIYQIDNYTFYFKDQSVVDRISMLVCLDNPFITITNNYYTIETKDDTHTIHIKANVPLLFSYEDYHQKMLLSYRKAQSIIDQMPAYDNTYDIVKYLHDYLATQVRYDDDLSNDDADTAYGALLEGKARCEGYTNAFSILLNLSGIENAKVLYLGNDVDSDIGHIWNLVKIDNNYYHVDVTNDSFSLVDDVPKDYVSYAYFLISTKDILRSSSINKSIIDLIPECDATANNFFIKNGLYFKDYNRYEIGKIAGDFLSDQLDNSLNGVSIKFESEDDYIKASSPSEINYLLGVISNYDGIRANYFNYYMYDNQLVISIYPKK